MDETGEISVLEDANSSEHQTMKAVSNASLHQTAASVDGLSTISYVLSTNSTGPPPPPAPMHHYDAFDLIMLGLLLPKHRRRRLSQPLPSRIAGAGDIQKLLIDDHVRLEPPFLSHRQTRPMSPYH